MINIILALEEGCESLPSEIIAHSLTALAQHATTAEAFDAIVDVVLEALRVRCLKMEEVEEDKLVVLMKALETIAGVKKGARISRESNFHYCGSIPLLILMTLSAARRTKLFTLLTPLSKHIQSPTFSSTTTFLPAYTAMLIPTLLLATLQDVLSAGIRQSIAVLFSQPTTPTLFGAACALTTSSDEISWNFFPAAILPHVLTTTAIYIGQSKSMTTPVVDIGFGEVSMEMNALTLLARLAWSGRLREAYSNASSAVKGWEAVVGPVCEEKIGKWIENYKIGSTTEEEVSFYIDGFSF